MKKEFVRCEACKTEISSGSCELASLKTTIDGKEYTFCCQNHAKRYLKKRKTAKR